jgi:hypothetical protein
MQQQRQTQVLKKYQVDRFSMVANHKYEKWVVLLIQAAREVIENEPEELHAERIQKDASAKIRNGNAARRRQTGDADEAGEQIHGPDFAKEVVKALVALYRVRRKGSKREKK